LLRKVKIDDYVCKIGLLKKKNSKNIYKIAVWRLCARRENAVCASWARRVRVVNTLQQLLALCKNVMDAVKMCGNVVWTLCGRGEDVVYTLWLGNLIFLGVFRGDPTARWHGFRTLYKRCGIAVGCDMGLNYIALIILTVNYH